MTRKTMLMLDNFSFESDVNPFDSLEINREYNYQSSHVMDGTELTEFKGRKADVITLPMRVYITEERHKDIVPALRKLGDRGEPVNLSALRDFGADYIGQYFVLSVKSNYTEFRHDGQSIIQEATITLKEVFSEDL